MGYLLLWMTCGRLAGVKEVSNSSKPLGTFYDL
jgi:hypothetical protein